MLAAEGKTLVPVAHPPVGALLISALLRLGPLAPGPRHLGQGRPTTGIL